MKLNEFLKTIGTELKIELPAELTAVEVELPAGFETSFAQNYLTRERAQNDDVVITEVNKKSNKTVFTEIDEQIKEFLPYVSDESKQKINSTFRTGDKLKLLKPAIDEAIAKTKGKAAEGDIRKLEEEYTSKIKSIQDSAKAERDQLQQQMEEKNFDFYATQKISSYTVADAFKQTKGALNAMALLMLKQKGYKYDFENGSVVVRQLKDGTLRDVYDDAGKKVTFESIVDTFMTPFIAKSNGGDNNQTPPPDKVVIKLDGNSSLRDRMMAAQV